MMILYTTVTSPYGRKVRMAAIHAGLNDQIERKDVVPADSNDPMVAYNPLGKMPCLVLENDEAIFDSPVIVEYLDIKSGGKLIPMDRVARMASLRNQALADGLIDAAIAMMIEPLFRPAEHVSQKWVGMQREKVERALAAFTRALPPSGSDFLSSASLASALGYLDWRKPVPWREEFKELVAWLDEFRAHNPEYEATAA